MFENGPDSPEVEQKNLTEILDELYDFNNLHGYIANGEIDALTSLRTMGDLRSEELRTMEAHFKKISRDICAAADAEGLTRGEAEQYRTEFKERPESQISSDDERDLRQYWRKISAVYNRLIQEFHHTDSEIGVVHGFNRPSKGK